MITVEEFNLMSVHERVTNVLAHGTELLERIYVFYVVKLYALGDFYVEIWYHQTTNRIDRVNSVKLDDVLHLYESQINISDLFS